MKLPVAEAGGDQLFDLGFGLDLRGDLETFGFTDLYAEAGLSLSPEYKVPGKAVIFASGGGGFGLFAYPVPRLKLRAAASGGVYTAYLPSLGAIQPSWYWKAGAEAGYRMSPGASILANASYASYQLGFADPEPLYRGFSFGITLDLSLSGSGSSGIRTEELRNLPVFPVNYSAYGKEALGTLRVINAEQAELRNVRVSFLVGSYSAEAATCATIPYIARGAGVEVPIFASFNPNVLGLTENTKMQGEARIDYELLGAKLSTTKAVSVSFLHRNAFTWADADILAGFVSPNDPAVLDLSKYVAGLIRERLRPDLDKSFQFGMGLFESLRLLGLKYARDPSTPYAELHRDPSRVDYIQYPYQSLAYKGGDSDDLAVLYAALLESVGIGAAFAVTDSELLVAFPLQMADAQAKSSFLNPADFIYRDGQAWLPLQVSRMREGFLLAWQGGARLWKEASAKGQPVFVDLASAWKKYQPVGLPGIDYRSPKPEEAQVNLAFENAMSRFVAQEVEPRAQRMLADMGGRGTGRQYNSLGILYARYGLLKEATGAFLQAVNLGYGPANTNLANVAYLLKDFETAVKYFEAALKYQPDNKAALIGLARAKYEIDAYAEADELFSKVSALDPELARRYAYLSSTVDVSTARASSAAADRGGATAWDEGQ